MRPPKPSVEEEAFGKASGAKGKGKGKDSDPKRATYPK